MEERDKMETKPRKNSKGNNIIRGKKDNKREKGQIIIALMRENKRSPYIRKNIVK